MTLFADEFRSPIAAAETAGPGGLGFNREKLRRTISCRWRGKAVTRADR